LTRAGLAEKHGDIPAATEIYSEAESFAISNAANLCVLSWRFCDLMRLTNSESAKINLLKRALNCAQQAVNADPSNATAHASLAVCYAKNCAFADIKGELVYSRLFKLEAEKTIALDPKQDIAYYLLGRWNYGIANVGLVSRTFVKVVYGGLPKASNEDAITNFQKAIELAPERIIHHAGLAMAYEAIGDKKSEITELKKCRTLKPTDAEDKDAQREAEKKLTSLGD
jgi:tetratricopeptide (TPR) repeat protein